MVLLLEEQDVKHAPDSIALAIIPMSKVAEINVLLILFLL